MVGFYKVEFGFSRICISVITVTVVQSIISSGGKSHKLVKFWDVGILHPQSRTVSASGLFDEDGLSPPMGLPHPTALLSALKTV